MRKRTPHFAVGLAAAWLAFVVPPLGAQEADTAAVDTVSIAPVPPTQDERDEEIRAELQAIFDRVPSMEDVDVTVSAGVVRLAGEVASRTTVDRAVELAQGRDGVVFVDGAALTAADAQARLVDMGSHLREQLARFLRLLPLLGAALVVVVLFWFLAWLAGRPRKRRLFKTMNPFLAGLLQRLLQAAIFVVGLILALEVLDATALVGAVVGTAGLAGLAFGFAFKDIAENYLAGIILSLRQPFEKNDLIVVGGHEGKVVRLTGRETILMTPDGNHVQIPNGTVFREPMVNYTRNPKRRFVVKMDVAAETDLARALDVGLQILREMKGVVDEPAPSGLVTGAGNGTMALQFFGWVDQRQAEFGRVRSEAIRLTKEGLEAAGIDLPSPEYRVTMEEPGAAAERSAARRERAAPPSVATSQRDVSVDTTLDRQIEEDRRAGDGEDLLE